MSGHLAPGVARLHAWSIAFAVLCAVPPSIAFTAPDLTPTLAVVLVLVQAVLLSVAIALSVAAWRRQSRALYAPK